LPAATIAGVTILLVGAGGFFGAILRYLVDSVVTQAAGATFPWGTLVINLTGSFALGLLFAVVVDKAVLPTAIRAPVLIGFIGAYTTFSTFELETYRAVVEGTWFAAGANVVGSVVAGYAALWLGIVLGRLV
jgi:CrcB protein